MTADIVIIGSGAGGGTLAWALRNSDARVLILERGDYLPQETANWDPIAVFNESRYKPTEHWEDHRGQRFKPGVHYFVGGNTKVYGAALPRFRKEDFETLEHEGGTSPSWPLSYEDLEPYYTLAEELFRVHGSAQGDPTEPPRSAPYPCPSVPHEPQVSELAEKLTSQGLQPYALPMGLDLEGRCIRCHTCDGFPCKVHAKSDAEVCCVRPALASENVSLWTGCLAQRLLPGPDGQHIRAIEVDHNGEKKEVTAHCFIVACGAVNSAALFLRSADGGLANSSGQVGRNYMMHNNSALMAVHPWKFNRTVFQKTLAINDYYFRGPGWEYPLGNLQIIGKVQGTMLRAVRPNVPGVFLDAVAQRSMDWWVMSEDLPIATNRVTLSDSGCIRVHWQPTNVPTHQRLLKEARAIMRRAGYTLTFAETMGIATNSHQCGTLRMGPDPASSVLDSWCRTHDLRNVFVADASTFPSSAAMNPALTIAALSLRLADHLKANGFC